MILEHAISMEAKIAQHVEQHVKLDMWVIDAKHAIRAFTSAMVLPMGRLIQQLVMVLNVKVLLKYISSFIICLKNAYIQFLVCHNSKNQVCNRYGYSNQNCGKKDSCGPCMKGYKGDDCGECMQGYFAAYGTYQNVNTTTGEGIQCIGNC